MSTVAANDRVLSTLNADGSRRWLRPRPSAGRFLKARKSVGYGLIAIFVSMPHLRIAEKPPLLIDLPAREFTFFGTTLYPTDTLLLALLMISVFLSIFFLTAMFGRVWCGWACPQTVYMELVYRPIERLLDGVSGQKAKKAAWRKPLRFVIYLLISFGLANTFLAYFVGTDRLSQWVLHAPTDHWGPFLLVIAVTALMLFDFGFFREQMCIVACPYGRFQSVLLDRNSLIISYDPTRGEPRGKKRRGRRRDVSLPIVEDEAQGDAQGDCIDCHACVTTCPTGIDIREGLQLECINCAQCVDACDAIMDKLGKPRGLIRYGSQASVLDRTKQRFLRTRTVLYPLLITGLMTAFVVLLVTRQPAFVSVMRGPGMPFTIMEGQVINTAVLKVQNRTPETVTYTFMLANAEGTIDIADSAVVVEPGETVEAPALFRVPPTTFVGATDSKFLASVRVVGDDGFEEMIKHRLVGPANGVLRE
ncbi:MAG: cytochrome c oxidase accessory protein CcoG [Planctomycetota bacterium]